MANIRLFLKQLKIMGIPIDIIDLIKKWLEDRSFYVSIDGKNLMLIKLLFRMVQGLIQRLPSLCYFCFPLFEITQHYKFFQQQFHNEEEQAYAGADN
jgi:hypothetical protein